MFDYDGPKKSEQGQPTTSRELNKLICDLEVAIDATFCNEKRLEGIMDRIASLKEVHTPETEPPKALPYRNGHLLDLYNKIQHLNSINKRSEELLSEIEKAI